MTFAKCQRRHIQIFQHSHTPEGTRDLKSATQTRFSNFKRGQLVDAFAIQVYRAAVGLYCPVQDIC